METPHGDQWVNATDFAGVQNPTEWDLLLTRGSGLPSMKDLTRDSLFVKFDPLVQKRELLPMQDESTAGRISGTNDFGDADPVVGIETDQKLVDADPPSPLFETPLSPESGQETEVVDELLQAFEGLMIVQSENNNKDIQLEITQTAVEEERSLVDTTDGDQWMNATDFAAVQNPTEWDLLLTRGSGLPSTNDLTRDSLFVKFDPLVQKRKTLLPKQVDAIAELNESGRISESSEFGDKSCNATIIEADNEKLINTDLVPVSPQHIENPESPEPEISETKLEEESEEIKIERELEALKGRLEQSEKEKEDIKKETTLAKQNLNEMESCFAEVLLNYESGKLYQRNFEHNQKILEARIAQLESCLARRDEKYEYVEMKVLEMTEEMKKEQEARLKILSNENYKLKASLKMSELKIKNVENEIDHVTTSNANLQKLCDEMIQQC